MQRRIELEHDWRTELDRLKVALRPTLGPGEFVHAFAKRRAVDLGPADDGAEESRCGGRLGVLSQCGGVVADESDVDDHSFGRRSQMSRLHHGDARVLDRVHPHAARASKMFDGAAPLLHDEKLEGARGDTVQELNRRKPCLDALGADDLRRLTAEGPDHASFAVFHRALRAPRLALVLGAAESEAHVEAGARGGRFVLDG
mmetsp:Transcript_225/g.800  ORF Transcript_225/g.800 Transcript_225/m.800 type:complete len:201 (-) Transcript_225:26-628(-)